MYTVVWCGPPPQDVRGQFMEIFGKGVFLEADDFVGADSDEHRLAELKARQQLALQLGI
jgi:hypothetical protein